MPTLSQYEAETKQLIQLVWTGLIPAATLDSYINIARMQLAADAECIRNTGVLTTVINQRGYKFPDIFITGPGVGDPISLRQLRTGNAQPIDLRPWEWFQQYYLPGSVTGMPVRAAQQGQGFAGTFYFDPIPSAVIQIFADVTCLPIPLVDNSTFEAIPYPWTDAVPFYAAGYGMMQLQRQADAQQMFARYYLLAQRGRQISTPTELPDNLPGGVGAHAVALKSTLTTQPQQQRGG
jgi:hypothetical protein